METSPSIDIDATLSELPFFPEECTLSQLPFFSEDRVDFLPLPPTPPSVCEECWRGPFAMHFGIPCMSPQDGKWYGHWPEANTYVTTSESLESRANAGCVWCRFILGCGSHYRTGTVTVTVWGTREKREEGSCWRQEYQILDLKIKDNREYFDFLIIHAAPDDPAASYIPTRSPILDVKSPRALALARQMIDDCVDKHECCRRAASRSPRLPTRLVDCTDLARPRLISTSGGEHGDYLALSYVWGKDSEQTHYRTTTSNLPTYEHRIDPSVLPLTIRDAIYVTHTLGFRWLWVDGLCIIQDSDSDKTHEIGRMHHVYRYAYVTIMAGSAKDVGSGFLQQRPPLAYDVALPFICPPHPPNCAGYQDDHPTPLQVGQVYLTTCETMWKAYEDELGCMATRAWCMQEYLLSPRALIFTPRTILFRCLTAEAGTVGVDNLHYSISDDPRIPTSLFLPPTAPTPEPDSKEWNEMWKAWTRVIEDYTGRTASDPSDKLVACAAVAEQFHRALGSEYLAGFWRSDALLVHLLWQAEHSMRSSVCGRGHARPAAYRAPSWSWAAIDGPTRHYHANECALLLGDPQTVALAKVAECWVALEHPELPFGRVADGALVLRGAPILCNNGLAIEPTGGWSRVPLPSFGEVWHQWQCGLGGLILDEEDGIYPTKPGGPHAAVTMDCDVDELPGRIWLVPFVRRRNLKDMDINDGDDYVHGIALEITPPSNNSVSAPEKIRFRRIGYFSSNTLRVARPGEDF